MITHLWVRNFPQFRITCKFWFISISSRYIKYSLDQKWKYSLYQKWVSSINYLLTKRNSNPLPETALGVIGDECPVYPIHCIGLTVCFHGTVKNLFAVNCLTCQFQYRLFWNILNQWNRTGKGPQETKKSTAFFFFF